jgi:hypothetical protein
MHENISLSICFYLDDVVLLPHLMNGVTPRTRCRKELMFHTHLQGCMAQGKIQHCQTIDEKAYPYL